MKYTAIAAVLAGLFAVPAVQAAENTVNLYGIAQLGLTIADNGDTNKLLVEDTGSRIGFKGEELLGNGSKAFFQIESAVAMDNAGASGFATREGWLGLKGDFGTVKLGRGKTYFDLAQEGFDGFNGNSTMINSLLIDGAYYRMNNSIAYETVNMDGFTGKLQYGDMEGKDSGISPYALIGSLAYENGPLSAVFAFENQKDLPADLGFGSKPLAKDPVTGDYLSKGLKIRNYLLGAGYTLPTGTNLKAAVRLTDIDGAKRNTFIAVVAHPFGDVTGRIGFTQAGDIDDVENTGGSYLAVGVDYPLSKRSIVYTEFSYARNDSAAGGLMSTTAGQAAGERKNSAWTTGLIHLF